MEPWRLSRDPSRHTAPKMGRTTGLYRNPRQVLGENSQNPLACQGTSLDFNFFFLSIAFDERQCKALHLVRNQFAQFNIFLKNLEKIFAHRFFKRPH
jgi:hypothetical protein